MIAITNNPQINFKKGDNIELYNIIIAVELNSICYFCLLFKTKNRERFGKNNREA